DYRIPAVYLASPLRDGTKEALIDAVLPELRAIDWSEKQVPSNEVDHQISILLSELSSTTSVSHRSQNARARLSPLSDLGTKFNLSDFRSGSMNGFFDQQRSSPKVTFYSEFLANEDVRHPLYIECQGDEARPNPECQMVFDDDYGLLFQVSFRKSLLS